MNYEELKQEIEDEFSECIEVDGVYQAVKFSGIFSHDMVIKKCIDNCILPSELNSKPKRIIPVDNRFLPRRLRKIISESNVKLL